MRMPAPGLHAGAELGGRATAGSSLAGAAAPRACMTIVFARLLGLEFLPKLEEGNLWIRATLPPTISLQEGNAYVNEMRSMIRARPEVESVVSQHGRPDDGTDAAGFFNAEFFAPLKPLERVAGHPRQGRPDRANCWRSCRTSSPASNSTSRNICRTTSRRPSRA